MVLPKKKPVTTQELRKFGLQIGGIFLAIALFVLWHKGAGHKVFMVTGLLGVYLVGFGAALPDSLAGFHRFWLKLADLLGRYVGHYVGMAFFSLLYWILFAPVAVIMRIVGFDPLGIRKHKHASTYWHPRKAALSSDHYERQFSIERQTDEQKVDSH